MCLKEAELLANELISKYAPNKKFNGFYRDTSSHGVCYPHQGFIALEESSTKKSSIEHVRFIIMHEIAHLLEPDDGHGKKWKTAFDSIIREDLKCEKLKRMKL